MRIAAIGFFCFCLVAPAAGQQIRTLVVQGTAAGDTVVLSSAGVIVESVVTDPDGIASFYHLLRPGTYELGVLTPTGTQTNHTLEVNDVSVFTRVVRLSARANDSVVDDTPKMALTPDMEPATGQSAGGGGGGGRSSSGKKEFLWPILAVFIIVLGGAAFVLNFKRRAPSLESEAIEDYVVPVAEIPLDLPAEAEEVGHEWAVHNPAAAGYQIIRQVAVGGMATIYEAEHTRWGTCILKVLLPSLEGDEDLVVKFKQEGAAIARINEASGSETKVVKVFEYGELADSGRSFICMEKLQGLGLERLLAQNGALLFCNASQLLKLIAAALQEAHEIGITHRDVKPDNVMVVSKDPLDVRLIDFGVARHEFMSARTLTGTLVGSPRFMSPEQANSKPVDHRTDIYSLGVLAWTLSMGSPPFNNQNPLVVLKQHVEEVVPVISGPDVPEAYVDLVSCMLEKDPIQRPALMADVILEIDRIRSTVNCPQ